MNYATAITSVRQRLGPAYAAAIEEAIAGERQRFGLMLAAIDARYNGEPIPEAAHTVASSEHCCKLLCLSRTKPTS